MPLFSVYQHALAEIALLFSLLVTPAWSLCDSRLCAAGCGTFDAKFTACNFDHQVFSSYEACLCVHGSADFEQSLLNCLSCNGKVLGINTAGTYEKWAIVCGEYQVNGEQAAIALENGPYESMNSFYLSSVIPAASSICPANFASATTSLVTTTPGSLIDPLSTTLPVSTTKPLSTTTPVLTSSSSIAGQTPSTSTATTSSITTPPASSGAATGVEIPVAFLALALGLCMR